MHLLCKKYTFYCCYGNGAINSKYLIKYSKSTPIFLDDSVNILKVYNTWHIGTSIAILFILYKKKKITAYVCAENNGYLYDEHLPMRTVIM